MLLIGSTAAHIQTVWTDPKDLDFIVTPEKFAGIETVLSSKIVHSQDSRHGKTLFVEGFPPLEFGIALPGSSAEMLLDLVETEAKFNTEARFTPFSAYGEFVFRVPTLDVLYALKLSHRYLKNSPHFLKTMQDIHKLRKLLDCKAVHPGLEEFFKLREKETYSYAHPKLNQSKKNFFSDDNINYIYDHDTIHEAVKHLDAPAFEYIKEDTAEVKCSKAKFFTQPEKIKLYTVLEESYVLALERCLIPFNFSQSPEWAFKKALEKVCTSIASGWWREYAWENYDEIVKLYSDDYVTKFERARIAGLIKPYKEAA